MKDEYDSIINDIISSFKLLSLSVKNLHKLKEKSAEIISDNDILTSDILHHLELEEYIPGMYPKLGKQLKNCRLERRQAKDTRESCIKMIELLEWKHSNNIIANYAHNIQKIKNFKDMWHIERSYKYRNDLGIKDKNETE